MVNFLRQEGDLDGSRPAPQSEGADGEESSSKDVSLILILIFVRRAF